MKIKMKSSCNECSVIQDLKKELKEHLSLEKGNYQDNLDIDLMLYILMPEIKEYRVIIDLVQNTHKNLKSKTGYLFISDSDKGSFDNHQLKSVKAIGELVKKNGAIWFETIDALKSYIQLNAANA